MGGIVCKAGKASHLEKNEVFLHFGVLTDTEIEEVLRKVATGEVNNSIRTVLRNFGKSSNRPLLEFYLFCERTSSQEGIFAGEILDVSLCTNQNFVLSFLHPTLSSNFPKLKQLLNVTRFLCFKKH